MVSPEREPSSIKIPTERITHDILLIRVKKVILDEDIADIYGVSTKRLNEQVRRNKDRFPEDFMFQLSEKEFAILRSQFATSRWGGRRYPPFAFTEHGAVMLASVLRSEIAMKASIHHPTPHPQTAAPLSPQSQANQAPPGCDKLPCRSPAAHYPG